MTIKCIDEPHIDTPGENFWPILAGLRFFFAFWVLCDHTYIFGPASRAMPVLSLSGLMPVTCFLSISGFSIHHSICTQPVGYFARRFWRIFPTNIATVAIAFFAYQYFGFLTDGAGHQVPPPDLKTWLVYLIPAQAVIYAFMPVLFPSWSLSIEVIYYLIAPILVRTRANVIVLLAMLSAAAFATWNYFPRQWAPEYVAEATNGIGLAVFAWAWLSGWIAYSARHSNLSLALFLVAGCLCVLGQPYGFGLLDKVANVSAYATWLITTLILFKRPKIRMGPSLRRALNYLGDISFPLYLCHFPILFVLTSSVFKSSPGLNYGVTQVAIALLAAAALLHFVDRPFRKTARSLPSGIGHQDTALPVV
jgi:peptidoglycan/LPS O-acetylase OafA/YrhL